MKRVVLARPEVTESDIQSVVAVLHTPNLALGPVQSEFEKEFAAYQGTKYAQAVCNGTSALHLILSAYGINEGDEVITSPFSFVASGNCILFNRSKPVFCDIEPEFFNINIAAIEEKITPRTKAILVVDVFGYPVNIPAVREICDSHGLVLIEDSCEALGAKRAGAKAGSLADAATFGFYPNKQITTGEGGMVVTNNEKINDLVKSLKNQGRSLTEKMSFVRLGYDYRISDINCALGLSQLRRLDEMLLRRKKIAEIYNYHLQEVLELQLFSAEPDVERSWFVYVVKLGANFNHHQRDAIIERLSEKGIDATVYFPSIHLQPLYRERFGYKVGDFPVSEAVSDRVIALPFYSTLAEEDVKYVCDNFKTALLKVQ